MNGITYRMALIGVLAVSLGLLTGTEVLSAAATPEQFYKGKTVTIIVPGAAGNPGDLLARTIAPYLQKEIGASRVQVEARNTDEGNNYVYNSKPDGLTMLSSISGSILGNDVMKAPGVRYHAEKFIYVADVYRTLRVFQISPKLPYKTLEALRKAKGLRGGGTSAKGDLTLGSAVMVEILGLDARVITGIEGKKNLTLAVGRGEVDFMAPPDNAAVRDEADGYVVNLFMCSDKKSTAVPRVPTLSEVGVKVPKDLEAVYRFVSAGGQDIALPPNVPQERVEYLRKAFANLSNNNDLRGAIEKLTGASPPAFVPGNQVQQETADIVADKGLATKLDAILKKHLNVR